ncbi:hypothetical protein [Oligoflexus tunisiensis]|nr:hypothetical protein [Oligoflexus tunisiensis]
MTGNAGFLARMQGCEGIITGRQIPVSSWKGIATRRGYRRQGIR